MKNVDFDLWQKKEYLSMKPGLERIRKFLTKVGNPEREFLTVHIAGTNGKGSVSKIISSVLWASGYKTGLYISPHLIDITERIQIDEEDIQHDDLRKLGNMYHALAVRCHLTFFEFMTALAFIYFAQNRVNVAVLETGLGGRFDATNVVERPLVTVITDVNYDHTAVLGTTLKKIAFEKAGIIKDECIVVSGVAQAAALKIIDLTARRHSATLIQLGRDFRSSLKRVNWYKRTQNFDYRGLRLCENFELSLLGRHQVKNAAVALAALEVIDEGGVPINFKKVSTLLRHLLWPGRFDVRKVSSGGAEKTLILDGAHNPSAIRALVETLRESPWGKKKITIVFDIMKDKEFKPIIALLSRVAKNVSIFPLGLIRELSTKKLVRLWERFVGRGAVCVIHSLKNIFSYFKKEDVYLVCGSLFLVGRILKEINHMEKTNG